MREFFQGWRRKIGCGLLLVTLLLASHWMRTWFVIDRVGFSWIGRVHEIQSGDGGIVYRSQVGPAQVSWYSTRPLQEGDDSPSLFAERLAQHAAVYLKHARPIVWVVLHKWLVPPLTLASAMLLLWPRRRQTIER